MMWQEKVVNALSGLKDFQLSTVNYVFSQFYENGRDRMLIADEVGLGKTIVAKGIIAKAFANRMQPESKSPKQFKVVYVCSNQALSHQNLKKLNFTEHKEVIDHSVDDDRLTSLAYKPITELNAIPFLIKGFTPATSFDDKTHAGKADERILIYRLLCDYADFSSQLNSLKWMLKASGRMNDENWESRISNAEKGRDLRSDLKSRFRRLLEEEVANPNDPQLSQAFEAIGVRHPLKFWTLLVKVCELGFRKNNYNHYRFPRKLVSALRFRLTKICADYLDADLFVLDEFQRYKQIIQAASSNDTDSPAIQLAKLIFSRPGAKVLMLSATPFKPYTNDFDEMNGELHYEEFKTVLRFLVGEKDEKFWKSYEEDRKNLFSFLRHPREIKARFEEAALVKNRLEGIYREGMVRTERLLAARDRDSLVHQVESRPLEISKEDIEEFVEMDKVTLALIDPNSSSNLKTLAPPVEYSKSCPFPWSFLDKYQHKERLRQGLSENADEIRRLLRKNPGAWINLEDIQNYRPLHRQGSKKIPNAKFRHLLDLTVTQGGWKYLWVPPSLPYYPPYGAYSQSEQFTKTLVFSSWKMVPRMIASLVSYEVERLSVGAYQAEAAKIPESEPVAYFQKHRTPRPQFTFKHEVDAGPQQMNNFMLAFPCAFLAMEFDPATNLSDGLTSTELLRAWKERIKREFKRLNLNACVAGTGKDWRKWLWLAPLLFDRETKQLAWPDAASQDSKYQHDSDEEIDSRGENKGRIAHFQFASDILSGKVSVDVPKLSEEQLDQVCSHMADLALGGPGICVLRAMVRLFKPDSGLLPQALDTGIAFLAHLNKPESISVLKVLDPTGDSQDYWLRVLSYCAEGNIQAMLDEYVSLLVNCESLSQPEEICDQLISVLSVRTSRSDIDGLKEFLERVNKGNTRRNRSLRTHYAAEFGNQKMETAGRHIHVREAFNSPFRPFVLATTSIGQEGLDFHYYCRRIYHWNLPSNPVDFEQREGRIHRYKGFVIRKILAEKYGKRLAPNHLRDIWGGLYLLAEEEKRFAGFQCDLVPFWHAEAPNGMGIDRIVPIYPLSKDVEKFKRLKAVLTRYRLTFGQPRQEELVESLMMYDFDESELKVMNDLMINLSPILFDRSK